MKDSSTAASSAATSVSFKMSRDKYLSFMRVVFEDDAANPSEQDGPFYLSPDLKMIGKLHQWPGLKIAQVFADTPLGPVLALWKGPDGGEAEITVVMRRPTDGIYRTLQWIVSEMRAGSDAQEKVRAMVKDLKVRTGATGALIDAPASNVVPFIGRAT